MADIDQDEEFGVEDDREYNIGKCQKCQYFDVDRDEEEASDETLAPCLHPDMEEFELVVSGDSGCNLFEICEDLDDEDEDLEDEDEEEEDEEEEVVEEEEDDHLGLP